MLTLWADSCGDLVCFLFAGMYAYSEIYHNNAENIDNVKKDNFKSITGVDFDDYMMLDKLNKPYDRKYETVNNKSFLYLYNDPLLGIFDSMLSEGLADAYKKLTPKLKKIKGGEFQYVFDTLAALSKVLEIKCDLGKRMRNAYEVKEFNRLDIIGSKDIDILINDVKNCLLFFNTMGKRK